MDSVVHSAVLSTLKRGRNFTLTGKEKFGSDFFRISPLAESMLSDVGSYMRARAASAEEAAGKVALREAHAALKGASALSFHLMEAGSPKLFYPMGKVAFFPIDIPSEGFYIHGREVLTFDPHLASACRYRITERAGCDLLFFPIKQNEKYRGMLIAEGKSGKELAFDYEQLTKEKQDLDPASKESTKRRIEHFAKLAPRYSPIVKDWFDPTNKERAKFLIKYFAELAVLYSLVMKDWFDPTTGLLSRNCFQSEIFPRMSRWLEKGMDFTLVLLDLDRFKAVNDTYGHEAGNKVLRMVGETLVRYTKSTSVLSSSPSRYPDLFFRWLQGDEFLGILQGIHSEKGISIVRRLQHEISKIKYGSISISASAGMLDTAYIKKMLNGGNFDIFDEIDKLLYLSKDRRGSLSYMDTKDSLKVVVSPK